MGDGVTRREFAASLPAAAAGLAYVGRTEAGRGSSAPNLLLEPFDYQGVRLLPSHWQQHNYYDIGEGYPYFMYFDRKDLPWRIW